jgi:hypothetical protein
VLPDRLVAPARRRYPSVGLQGFLHVLGREWTALQVSASAHRRGGLGDAREKAGRQRVSALICQRQVQCDASQYAAYGGLHDDPSS